MGAASLGSDNPIPACSVDRYLLSTHLLYARHCPREKAVLVALIVESWVTKIQANEKARTSQMVKSEANNQSRERNWLAVLPRGDRAGFFEVVTCKEKSR